MCCLKYENDEYESAKEQMPDIGKQVMTPDGAGKVVGLNLLERIVQVNIPELERVLEYAWSEIENLQQEMAQLTK